MGKMDKISIKKRKIWELLVVLVEKSKKIWEKCPNLINAQDLIIAQGGFFSKNNKHTGWILDPKTINTHCAFIRDCRVVVKSDRDKLRSRENPEYLVFTLP